MAQSSSRPRSARVATDLSSTYPRLSGVMSSVPRTAAFLRTHPRASLRLGANVWLDEVVIALLRSPALLPTDEDIRTAGQDVRAAYELWGDRGWLTDPASYHEEPGLPDPRVWYTRTSGRHHHAMTFPVNHAPHPGEPARDRWLAREQHRTAHATLLRQREPGNPWLICVHGFSQGTPGADHKVFLASRLHDALGINLAFPVLPSHGARRPPGGKSGEGFTSVNIVDGIHGVAQAVWEVRSLVRWIRSVDPGAPIGIHGISLGSCVAAVVASLEPDLSCVIASIPVADLFALYARNSPRAILEQTSAAGAAGVEADAIAAVVSPLRLDPLVPHDRRFIVAGLGDQMSTTLQAEQLWEHWERPAVHWYEGGHIGYFLTRTAATAVEDAVRTSLLT